MKLFFFALSLAFTVATTSANAVDSRTIPTIMKSFGTQFPTAKDIKWNNTEDFLIVEFKMNDKLNFVYYNQEGELIVLATPIPVSQLNASLQKQLAKKFKDYTIADVYVLNDRDEVKYSAVAVKDGEKLILSSTGTKWQVIKKVKN
jgi:hypothetical protein